MVNKGHALSRDELIRVLTAYTGITTADGALDGTTLIDSTLIGRNDFVAEKVILIMGGDCKDEDKGAVSFNSGDGTITLQGTGFSAQIKKGTIYRILNISSVEIDVAAINSKIGTNTDPSGTTTLFARLRQIVDDYLASASTGMAAIKAVVDALEGKLDDGSHGLAALKLLIDSVELKLDDGVYGLAALKALIDAIEGKLDNPVFGLINIKTEIEAMEIKLDDPIHGLINIEAEIEAIETKLDDPVHGLAKIKTEIEVIEAKLDDPVFGLANIKSEIQAIETKLDDGTYGLSALKLLIDAIEGKLDNGTYGLSAIKTLIDAVEGKLDNGTYGLSALKALIDAVEAKLDSGTSGLDALKALIDDLETKLDRLRGESPATGSVTGNWQSGTATSGETGADLVTIGANDTKYKLHSLIVSIHNLAAGAKAAIKLFQQVNGIERKVYEEDFNKDSVPNGCWVVNGTVGIHEALRVEIESNKVADNGAAIDYDYMLEAM